MDLKREAIDHKREGNLFAALATLHKIKGLEALTAQEIEQRRAGASCGPSATVRTTPSRGLSRDQDVESTSADVVAKKVLAQAALPVADERLAHPLAAKADGTSGLTPVATCSGPPPRSSALPLGLAP